MLKKCIIDNCTNTSDQGKFIGEYCSPCHEYITQKKGIYSQAYRNSNSLEPKEQIIGKSFHPCICPSVYFLISKDKEIIYVGSSWEKEQERIQRHKRSGIPFETITILKFPEFSPEELLQKEADYIAKFQPRYNKSIPKNERWKSLSDIRVTPELKKGIIYSIAGLKNMAESGKIESVKIGNTLYINHEKLLKES